MLSLTKSTKSRFLSFVQIVCLESNYRGTYRRHNLHRIPFKLHERRRRKRDVNEKEAGRGNAEKNGTYWRDRERPSGLVILIFLFAGFQNPCTVTSRFRTRRSSFLRYHRAAEILRSHDPIKIARQIRPVDLTHR